MGSVFGGGPEQPEQPDRKKKKNKNEQPLLALEEGTPEDQAAEQEEQSAAKTGAQGEIGQRRRQRSASTTGLQTPKTNLLGQ